MADLRANTIARHENGGGHLSGNEYQELKGRIHDKLLNMLDLRMLDSVENTILEREIRNVTDNILASESVPLNVSERQQIIKEIQAEVLGLGPLEPLLEDASVSDILVNGYNHVYVERFGKLELTGIRFRDDNHLMRIIDKIASNVGRRIDESSPMVDCRLLDGSRVNAIIPPLALDGPALSIRRFAVERLKLSTLILYKALTEEIGQLLAGIVKARLNVLISGGTGSGKTTLLNVLSDFIPLDERVVTIEDAAELQLQHEHVVRLETRPPNIEGRGEVIQRDLVINCLRMRPDRIILGEVRGGEAFDMLQAMNTGHDGCLTTIHANSARDALSRLETMVSMTGVDIPIKNLRHYISSALDVCIQTARLTDGSRKILTLHEIIGMEGDIITVQEIFRFERTGIDENGKTKGRFMATGIRPRLVERLKLYDIPVPYDLFDPDKVYEV
ncbi:MAG: pilus assembly protein CpaF [Desulfobulbaceae bacterium C00003063]|nr:MAG: pilus assembly protein CpaF [Desulfobulbaceae bacterium C00003063]